MAFLELDPESGLYRIRFRHGGRPFKRSLKTNDRKEANAILKRVKATLADLGLGRLTIPDGADAGCFILSDGRMEEKPRLSAVLTVQGFFDLYREQLPAGAMEATSLVTLATHERHFARILGRNRAVQPLTPGEMQVDYVNRRAKATWSGKPIQADTIKKEIATFRAVWNWHVAQGRLTGAAPVKGLRFDKRREQPPFMTWEEIDSRIARGGLTEEETESLWDCLFLDINQIAEVLAYVKESATKPFLYPMFVFVAHTGARRSEMLRSLIDDFDFRSGLVKIREKKKDRSIKFTSRHVPMSPLLKIVMEEWFAKHPGGQFVICEQANTPFTGKEAWWRFRSTIAESKWEVLRGFHVFRHSFASNLAYAGVDQRVIDEFMGHQTEDMRKRYRHLFPKKEQQAIELVFGPHSRQ